MIDLPGRVERYCRVRTSTSNDEIPFPLDSDGFLEEPRASFWRVDEDVNGSLISPFAAAAKGPFVLLGEPGAGKTTVLHAIVESLPSVGHEVVWFDGTELSEVGVERFLRVLRALPSGSAIDESQSAAVFLTIVLDQIDESPVHANLAKLMKSSLQGRSMAGVRWLVACRAAEFPSGLAKVLERGGQACVLADLAPLTRGQAVELAGSAGVNGEDLVEQAVAVGAGALASIPLTLTLLVELHHDGEGLTGTPLELFDRSVRLLLEEIDTDRRSDLGVGLHQRLAIARRIAARLIMSGRRTIFTGVQLGGSRTDIESGGLANGTETVNGEVFEVTPELVKQTLSTALFAPRGQDHLGVVHSSMAAYLAATYLAEAPKQQLQELFLVASDDGHTSIPASLRETATWLITLSPAHGSWLTAADPQGLAAHSALIESDSVRESLIGALLDRAGEFELTAMPWQLYRSRLAHPGLPTQLAAVFADVEVGPPTTWATRARIRLALRLASQSPPSQLLTDRLLAIAGQTEWIAHDRRLAIDAIVEQGLPPGTVSRLRQLLDSLTGTEAAVQDPDDELRGVLLRALWPGHLTLEDLLAYIRPRSNPQFLGAYTIFLRRLPVEIDDSDIPRLLSWAAEKFRVPRSQVLARELQPDPNSIDAETAPHDVDAWADVLAEELLEPLLDRATARRHHGMHDDAVARVVWPSLRAYNSLTLPEPLNDTSDDLADIEQACAARRSLCLALCRLAARDAAGPAGVWGITRGWSSRFRFDYRTIGEDRRTERAARRESLVDSDDLHWALEQMLQALADQDDALGTVLGDLAAALFNPNDPETYELGFRYESTPAWNFIRWHYEPIEIDSEYARMQRARHERQTNPRQRTWPEREEFLSNLREYLDHAVAGEPDAFWSLLWNLQFDPNTGRGQVPDLHDALIGLPAASHLEPDLTERLTEAALAFLCSDDDHREDWLGTDHYQKRAWAGYRALTLLDQGDRLGDLPDDRWSSWVGALVWYWPQSDDDSARDRKLRLTALAVQHAVVELSATIPVYVIGELKRASPPIGVNLADSDLVHGCAASLLELTTDVAAAITTATTSVDGVASVGSGDEPARPAFELPATPEATSTAARYFVDSIQALLDARYQPAIDWALSKVNEGVSGAHTSSDVMATVALLHTLPETYFDTVIDATKTNIEFGQAVATNLAGASRTNSMLTKLDEGQLGELYRWLANLQPNSDGPPPINAGGDTRDLRNGVLRELSGRITADALAELLRLQDDMPDRLDVVAAVATCRTQLHAQLWRPPSPAELIRLLADGRRRLVRSEAELADLLVHTIRLIAKEIPGHGELLWDRLGTRNTEKWRPKLEPALSSYIAHELKLRLEGRGLAVNREVLVKPTDAYGAGDRTDILVEAMLTTKAPGDPDATRIAVVLELKGQWNSGLTTDVRTQLADRYLPDFATQTGIYLIGWFPPDQWTATSDWRFPLVKRLSRDTTEDELQTTSREIHAATLRNVHIEIIEIPRPHKNSQPRTPQPA